MGEISDAPTPVEWRARYARGPDDLEASLAGLTEETIDIAAMAGEWTIREIVNHIAEIEVRATFIITVAIGNSGAPFRFDWFPNNNKQWGAALAFDIRPILSALATIRQIRAYVLALLDAIPDAGQRHVIITVPAISPEPMPRTVNEWLQIYTEHIDEHIAEIGKIRALHGI